MVLRRGLRTWLLAKDSDPSVRLRVLRDLLDRPADDPAVVGAQREIGRKATNWRLLVLSDLGLTKKTPRVAKAMGLFLNRFSRSGDLGGPSSEVCITGNAVRMMARFGYLKDPRMKPAIEWLVRHQKKDGGWHCFRSRTGTLDCWEALAAFAALPSGARTPPILRSIERGAEFYLERRLFREGPTPYRPWFRLHYPVHYYYDILVGLDTLTSLGYDGDPRMRPALDRLVAMHNRDGSWNMDALHPDSEDPVYQFRGPFYPLGLEVPGRPSRWITTTALSVLKRAGR
ncbi:MAG: hypothetical protein E6K03_05830 [Methanobacteriota archaeon]|nr:MAG: hypothetical protein E6K03_05830 [Euryarchaeota archaeon]